MRLEVPTAEVLKTKPNEDNFLNNFLEVNGINLSCENCCENCVLMIAFILLIPLFPIFCLWYY